MANDFSSAEPHGSWESQAQQVIEYYAGLVENSDRLDEWTELPAVLSFVDTGADKWNLGLAMGENWLRLIRQPHHNFSEIEAFIDVLRTEVINQGSGWRDLQIRVEMWVSEIKSSSRTN
ncbi:MAG TPA: hypothetical protein VGB45_09660 [Abditibacterium sp.]|jgi:hypothetical protein